MSRPSKPWFRKSTKCWYVWHEGKQVNLGRQKKAAQKRFHQLMANPTTRQSVPITRELCLAVLVDRFLDWVEKNRAPDTYEWYRYRLERLCQKYPVLEAAELRPYHLEDWVADYDFTQGSRRNYLRTIKRCYRWAFKQGYLDRNPISGVELPPATTRDVSLSPAQFASLLDFVRNDAFRALLQVTWETGCRPQESLRVEARHVDLARQRWVFPKSESKTKRLSRVVYLTDNAVTLTEKLAARFPTGPLFRNASSQPWTTDSVACAFQAVRVRMGKAIMAQRDIEVSAEEVQALIPSLKPSKCVSGREELKSPAELRCEAKRKLTNRKAAELAPIYSLYALRHSFATNALQKGVDSLTVAILLGHEDPSTLARVYQHLNHNPEHLISEVRKTAS